MIKKPIRALLLSAGLGTRLRPLTLNIPKCLVPINNKPLLENWIDALEKINTQKLLINTHYLHEKVHQYLLTQKYREIKIYEVYEKVLSGTAGTLIENYEFFSNSLGLMIHADNYTNLDLRNFIKAHFNRPPGCLLTMLTFNCSDPSSCGIVEVNSKKIVKNFYEKIHNPPSNLANGAAYIFEDDFLQWLIENYKNSKDFSTEVIPNLIGKIYTYHTDMPYIDIGTLESLEEARRIKKLDDLN